MLNVYIADDEVWIILGLKKLLDKLNIGAYVIGTANNGLTAKEEIGHFKPDVVFADIRMPGLSGLELLQAIPEVSPESKVVIISGYAEFSYAQEAVQHHAYDYLLKPIKPEELSRVMTAIINERDGVTDEERMPVVSDRMIDNVLSEIREHYMEDIAVKDIAGYLGYSEAYFCKLFKQSFGHSFVSYLTDYRMQKAEELMHTSRLSIKEIGKTVGYPDPNYFTKVFRRVRGVSPSEFRETGVVGKQQ